MANFDDWESAAIFRRVEDPLDGGKDEWDDDDDESKEEEQHQQQGERGQADGGDSWEDTNWEEALAPPPVSKTGEEEQQQQEEEAESWEESLDTTASKPQQQQPARAKAKPKPKATTTTAGVKSPELGSKDHTQKREIKKKGEAKSKSSSGGGDLDEDVDDQTRKRRQVLLQRINDFNAATELFGKATTVPVAQRKPKTKAECEEFITAVVEIISIFSDDASYVPFLANVLRSITPPLTSEFLTSLSSKLTVIYNERVRLEKEADASATGAAGNPASSALAKRNKKWDAKQRMTDALDAGLTTGGGRGLARDEALEKELDFM